MLIFSSALISGSEIAFFSLSPNKLKKLKKSNLKSEKLIFKLLKKPEELLATILISNNFINISIVILSTFLINKTFDFSGNLIFGFWIEVIFVSFLILLFGEIIPKVYATQYPIDFATFMVYPISFLEKILKHFNNLLISFTSIVNKRLDKKKNISLNDLSNALDLTSNKDLEKEKDILEGIVNFANIDVKEIMKARVNIFAIENKTDFDILIEKIAENNYSRIPIFDENLDNIKGILHKKVLLPFLEKNKNFNWQNLMHEVFYVPETKKIKDLLEEFQNTQKHLAIVVDEYGGTSGIVTLEDILEEIVGEIQNELNEEELNYKKIDDKNYEFKGKILLNDFCKIIDVDYFIFDEIKKESETLAGLILEIKKEIPKKNDIIKFNKFIFTIQEVDKRKINKIKIKIK
ncbi:MAG: hypothetical protein B6I24_02410 [Bacteroidetes bacterium 4572_128]|nr:MAG: hypothetical protein B6I24_02410 [Bacteroidetes bacterium 4572_128]